MVSPAPDDTQPRSPFSAVTPQRVQRVDLPEEDEQPESGGPGCLIYTFITVVVVGLAVMIVGLAAFAGWTSGQRAAQTNATATQSAAINEQLSRLPADLDGGNLALAAARLQYLATLTPAVPGVDGYVQTATAVYLTRQPTITPTPPAVPSEPAAPTVEATLPVQSADPAALDLSALLESARQSVSLRQWDSAIRTLEVILAADEAFEPGAVRSLLGQSLIARATSLLRSGDSANLAEGIALTDRAQGLGIDVSEISYESYIAGLYLDAINTIGIDFPLSIQKLLAVYNLAPGYMDVAQRLFDQYVAYGDAWVAGTDYCPAVAQYQAALGLFNDVGITAKRDAAQTACLSATPVGGGGTPLPPGQIAPIGVPGT